MKHTQDTKGWAMLLISWNEFLFSVKSATTNNPDILSFGHLVTRIPTSSLSWKTEIRGTTIRGSTVPKDVVLQNDQEFQDAFGKTKSTTPKVQICLTCEHEIKVNLSRKHTFDRRQTFLLSLVTYSLWTKKFDADDKMLKRDAHVDDVDVRDSKRMWFTHEEADKRVDLEMIEDTVAKRGKLFVIPFGMFSQHGQQKKFSEHVLLSRPDLSSRLRVPCRNRVGLCRVNWKRDSVCRWRYFHIIFSFWVWENQLVGRPTLFISVMFSSTKSRWRMTIVRNLVEFIRINWIEYCN